MFPCEYLDGEMPNHGFDIGGYYLMLRCRSTLPSFDLFRYDVTAKSIPQLKYNDTDGIKAYLTPRYDYIIRESQYRLKTATIANPNPYPIASALSLSRSSASERDFWNLGDGKTHSRTCLYKHGHARAACANWHKPVASNRYDSPDSKVQVRSTYDAISTTQP